MTKRYRCWIAACAALALLACSSGDGKRPMAGAPDADTSQGGASGSGGSGATAGVDGSTAGASGGGGDTSTFDDLMRLHDVGTEKLASCAGASDMSLCNVVTEPDRDYDVCVGGECVSPGCGEVTCNSAGPRFRMPPAWDHRYFERDAGEEPVVVDLITGLYWQGCFGGRSGDDCQTGAELSITTEAAFAYCGELEWGGHDDWYVPDAYEWGSLYTNDDSAYNDPGLFPDAHYGGLTSVLNGWNAYWTENDLFLDFPEDAVPVRCVRRGFSRSLPTQRLTRFAPNATVSDELIVRDAATGLDWQACGDCEFDGSPEQLVHADAIAYCEALVWAGFDDYRLPTVKEHLTTQNFRSLQGSSFNAFEEFKRGYLSHQADWGDPTLVRARVLTITGDLVKPGFTPPVYQTVCVRYGPDPE